MSDTRKAPADFLEQARTIAIPEAGAGDIALRDQRDAQLREGAALWRRIDRQAPTNITVDGVNAVAFELAVIHAWRRRRRQDRACVHAFTESARTFTVLLTTGHTFCPECAPRVLMMEDDGRCDICDRPAGRFTEVMMGVGPFIVCANLCAACMDFQRTAGTVAPRRRDRPARGAVPLNRHERRRRRRRRR